MRCCVDFMQALGGMFVHTGTVLSRLVKDNKACEFQCLENLVLTAESLQSFEM